MSLLEALTTGNILELVNIDVLETDKYQLVLVLEDFYLFVFINI